ncbi:MAG: hypothetical protein ABFS32_19370 [Bacteroidota bacterium]
MKFDEQNIQLETVDGFDFDNELKEILQPGASVTDENGNTYIYPRYFYKIDSFDAATKAKLTPNFFMSEFVRVDYRETELLRAYPRYIPLAVTQTAAMLEVFRRKVGTGVMIATNGGYRSPKHALNTHVSTHSWGTAANIFKIGKSKLNSEEEINKYAQIFRDVLPGVWVRPAGTVPGTTFDQLHIDLGYTNVLPKS